MLSFVVAAALAIGVETVSDPPAPFVPKATVFLYPSSSVAMFGVGAATNSGATLYAAAGTSVHLAERVSLDVELAGGLMTPRFSGSPGWIFSAGLGPSLQLTGDEAYRGLFVSMRFAFHAFRPAHNVILFASANQGPLDLGPGIARAFMGEVDLGYHFRFGRLYFAPIIGVGVGYAYDEIDPSSGFWLPFGDASTPAHRPQHIVWSLNLNLARLGVAL